MVVCATAENAEQALAKLDGRQIDLAIIDISLGEANGLQLTETIKLRAPNLPVLILTIHDEEAYAKQAFQAGARGFVTKHEASATVISAIRTMLTGREYISDSVTQKFLQKIHTTGTDA